ncbi:HYR domain-containing protein [Pyxidicoccus fallax]|uniref:HYR domain-containing protein n=1 Tax=Pyxidicoccus fallax TaxID=394095 RepID=A0A848LMF0_9BACT|nr:HYR domain-containing protein [Pyxidicoccus fallax]NMO18764.1 HYR domain-containing protein [Pyxidicoccus fallax]NPC79342.1 HYR domain-containing protein [Pyxidicoccus fallax]
MSRHSVLPVFVAALGCVALLVTACSPTQEAPVEQPTEPPAAVDVSPPFDVQAVIRRVGQSFRTTQESFTGEQETYSVHVGKDGTFRFSPRHWPEIPEAARHSAREEPTGPARKREPPPSVTGAPLEVRTVSLSLGGRPLARPVRTSVREDGALALDRGPVVEVLSNGDQGLEQRWELASRPEGSGDLEVRVELSGLEYVSSSEQGHHYRDRKSGLGVSYGKATWVDAHGVRTAVEPVREGGVLVMRVPAQVLEASAWPAVLDPVISPEITPGNRVSGPRGELTWEPSVAYAGGMYLVVWENHTGSSRSIQATRVQASNGAILDPGGIPGMTGTTTHQYAPNVSTNGTDFLVVWTTVVASGNSDIYGMRVSASTGRPLDAAPLRITNVPNDQSSPVAAYAGGNYFVAWQDARSGTTTAIYGARVSASSGAVLDSSGRLIFSTPEGINWPSIASDGTHLLVTWTQYMGATGGSGYNIHGARVRGSDGTVLGNLSLSTAPGAQRYSTVSFVGGHFLVVWSDARAVASGSEVYGTRVRASDGEVLDPQGLPLLTGTETQPYDIRVTVGATASHFLLIWEQVVGAGPNHVLQGLRIGTDGVMLDATPVPLSEETPTTTLTPAVGFDGSNLLVLWRGVRDNRHGIYGNRVRASDLTRLDTTPPLLVGGQLATVKSPVVAAGRDHYLVVWTDARDREGQGDVYGTRVRATDGVVLDPQGLAIGTGPGLQSAPSVAFDGSRFLVVWEDDRNSTSSVRDIYGAWVRESDGGVSEGSGFVVSNAARNQRAPKVAFGEGMYLVVWEDARGADIDMYGTRIRASDGTLLEPSGFIVGGAIRAQTRASVAYGAGVFLVAWEDRRTPTFYPNIYAARVRASDGGVLDSEGTLMLSTTGRQEYPAVAFDGSNFLTVWRTERPTGGVDLYGTRVSPLDGGVLDNRVLYTGVGAFQTFPGLGFDGSTYLLVCWDSRGGINRFDGVRIRPDGTLVDTTPFLIASMPDYMGNPAVPSVAAWGRGRFLVAYEAHDTVSGTPRAVMRRVSEPENGSRCASATDCTSGHCVAGVCCNSACTDGTCGSGTCVSPPPHITCPADTVAEATSASGAHVHYPAASATGSAPLSVAYSQASDTSFPLGTTPVTATVTDGLGRTDACSFDVIVQDTTPPTLTCPLDFSVDATSTTGATVSYPPMTTSDAVSDVKVSASPESGSHFDVGITPVRVSATDDAGNTASCGFEVTVSMPPAPEITCPADAVAEATSGAGAAVDYLPATATGSAPLSVAYSQQAGTRFGLGTTPVTATVTDGLGRTASCGFRVTVRDTTAPSLTCGADVVAEATSAHGAAVSPPLPSATDAVTSTPTVSASPAGGSTFPMGVTPVTVTATDDAGNSATCTFRVIVRDSTAPTLTCPQDVTAEATSAEGAVVDYLPATASDGVSSPRLRASQVSGSRFALGRTDVSVTATDDAGNASSCVFSITVRDSMPPALTCGTDLVAEATGPEGALVEFPQPTATDAVTAQPLLTASHPSGGLFPRGTTRVTVTATDSASNASTCAFTVTVRDTTPPQVGCPGSLTVEAESAAGAQVVFSVPAPRDDVTRSPTVSSSHAPGSLFPPGTTAVVLSAADEEGNTGSCTFSVTVRDTTPPVLTCPADVRVTNASPQGVAVEYPPATASDTASTPELGYSHATGGVFPVGTTQVTATARDGSGNSATCSFQVHVEPRIPVAVPDDDPDLGWGCGASSGTPGGLGWSGLMVLAWVAARRRRGGSLAKVS